MTALKTAILLTAGPVSSFTSFIQSGPSSLRTKVTKQQYVIATQELENIHLGTNFVTEKLCGKTQRCFVKKPPEEVTEVLALNPELCVIMDYRERYMLPMPKNVNLSQDIMQQILSGGYVKSQNQLFGK